MSPANIADERRLRLVVFDLDYTVWQPEMYQLYGGPKLVPLVNRRGYSLDEVRTNVDGKMLVDNSNTPIRVFPGAAHALCEIHRLAEEGHDIRAAVASRTDEPQWAHTCMQHLQLPNGQTLKSMFQDRIVIDCFHSKTYHLERLHFQTGVPFKDMVFFDNEYWNIECVKQAGVRSIYTPKGMSKEAWKEALRDFGMQDW
jgi:magnesium-dependent phosphatase 1